MGNIVLTRIDHRLIHGQVATKWCDFLQADLILVVNDEVSKNTFQQGLMDMAAPAMVKTRYWSIEQTIQSFSKLDNQRLFLLCASPDDVLELVEGGLPIHKVNIENMHMEPGKRQVAVSVAIDNHDSDIFKQLQQYVELEIKRLPQLHSEPLNRLF